MKDRTRKLLLGLALAGVLIWTAKISMTPQQPADLVSALPSRTHAQASSGKSASEKDTRLTANAGTRIRLDDKMKADLFIAAEPVNKPEPPPPPPPPAIPYAYIGQWSSDKNPVYYLLSGTTLYAAHKGEILDLVWKLTDSSGETIEFTYLPDKLKYVLHIGDSRVPNTH